MVQSALTEDLIPRLKILGIAGMTALLMACAPSGPIRPTEPSGLGAIDAGLSTGQGPRAATRADERADQIIGRLQRQFARGELSVATLLNDLSPYTTNEIAWQRRQLNDQAGLAPWLELAVITHAYKLDLGLLDTELEKWQARNQISNADRFVVEARRWVEQWRAGQHGPKVIGVVLPGQSPLAKPGDVLKDGLMQAWLGTPVDQRPKLNFYYVDDGPMSNVFSVIDQAQQDQVEWLIGPLPREQVEFILANRSARWYLPTLFLNLPGPEGLKNALGRQRLAFALNPEAEAKLAAQYAKRMGLDRALVLAQQTPWGEQMAKHFVEDFTRSGHRVIDQATYDPQRVDHSQLLEQVLGLDQSQRRIDALERLIGEPIDAQLQRRDDISFIYLAARATDARQIRPQLRFFRAEDLPVVMTSHAVEGAVDPRRDVDLEGVFMPMAPWFIQDSPQSNIRQRAEDLYADLASPTLSQLYAMGYDLMGLMMWLEALQADPDVLLPGMTGALSIDSSGQIMRRLPWITIDNGRAKQVMTP